MMKTDAHCSLYVILNIASVLSTLFDLFILCAIIEWNAIRFHSYVYFGLENQPLNFECDEKSEG